MSPETNPDTSAEGYRCPECGTADTTFWQRCDWGGCPDGRDQVTPPKSARANAAGQVAPVPPDYDADRRSARERAAQLVQSVGITRTSPMYDPLVNGIDNLSDEREANLLAQYRLRRKAEERAESAPVPPPVELETRARWERMASEIVEGITFDQRGDRVILDLIDARATIFDALSIAFDTGANVEHERAEGLAKEVERLNSEAELFRYEYEVVYAKLAVYEAPLADGEVEELAKRNAHLANLDVPFTDVFAQNSAMLRRLSAAKAEREGENTKLREGVLRTLDDIDRCVKTTAAIARDEIPGGRKAIPGTGVEISLDHITDATRELRAAIAPASEERS